MAQQPVTVELFYSGDWNDHTSRVYTRSAIAITYGSGDEQTEATTGSLQATLANVDASGAFDGMFNPRYPGSSLYGLIGRGTPIKVKLDTTTQDITDTFARTETDDWGSTDTGQAYTLLYTEGGVADFDVASGSGTQVVNVANNYKLALLQGVNVENGEALLQWQLPTANVTGANLEPANVAVRATDTSTYYLCRVTFDTSEALAAEIIDPAGSTLASGSSGSASGLSAGEPFSTRVRWDGPTLQMRTWRTSTTEPTTWDAEADDYTYLGSGGVGIRSGAASGNTNVPVTFSYDDFAVSTWSVRFSGEIASWQPRRMISGDAWTNITANGVLRRIDQGNQPALSQFHRTIISAETIDSLIGYWPCEDGTNSVAVGAVVGEPLSVISGGIADPIEFAASEGEFITNMVAQGFSRSNDVGTDPILNLAGGAQLAGKVPGGSSSPIEWTVSFLARTNALQAGEDITIARWLTPGGTYERWELLHKSSGLGLELFGIDSSGTSWSLASTVNEQFVLTEYRIDALQTGTSLQVRLWIGNNLEDDNTYATSTNAYVSWFEANPYNNAVSGVSGFWFGHIQVWDVQNAPSLGYSDTSQVTQETDADGVDVYPWFGWLNERTADRLDRLCRERGIQFVLVGDRADTARMGGQPADALRNLLAECERTDGGRLHETRQALALTYRTRVDLYSQTPVLSLDVTDAGVAEPLEPNVDDLHVRNDVTVKRANGSSARAVQSTGPLNVSIPEDDPQGAGRFITRIDVNPSLDSRLQSLADWFLHLGTVDETRYPVVIVDVDAISSQADTVSLVDVGHVVDVDGVDGGISLMALGYTETIGSHRRIIEFNAAPASPYDVFTLDTSRLASGGSTLTDAEDTTSTAWSLTTTAATSALWSTDAEPYDLAVDGERVTVTVNNDASSPQDVTVTRSVNDIVKSHSSGADVQIFQPNRLAL